MASALVMEQNSDLIRPRSGSFASLNAEQSKRARAGSISGRLRAASDLADFGWINSNEIRWFCQSRIYTRDCSNHPKANFIYLRRRRPG